MTDERILLELEAWREACRHIEIGAFVAGITPSLARQLPFDLLFVRRMESDRARIETLAVGSASERVPTAPMRNECSKSEMEEISRWCRSSRVIEGATPEEESLLAILRPPAMRGAFLAVPLAGPHHTGVLLLRPREGLSFHAHHLDLVRKLGEPFAAALENDRRLHELARLREAVEADNRALLSRLARHDISESIVGADTGLKEVMERVQKVAPTDAPVLILGETGSGKEVIARAIHSRSPRARGPIVRVNCGAIPTELVDSELFGHEKGSFTGAIGTRQGWFERADGGTLFLDEIGELPAAAQVRLLRILQDGSFERVGGEQSLTVDVRLVAATHRQLEDMVAAGSFRQDLWYRVSVFPIRLPPLRERLDDIAELATHFAHGAGKRLAGVPLVPGGSDLELLLSYSWPGNVRELASVIERAAILGDGKRLDLAGALGLAARHAATPPPPRSAVPDHAASTKSLDDAMRKHIEQVLAQTRGQIEGEAGAARQLGINPHTLRARMRKLGIEWQRFRQAVE